MRINPTVAVQELREDRGLRRILLILAVALVVAAMTAGGVAVAAIASPVGKGSNSAEAQDFPDSLSGEPREAGNEGETNFGHAQSDYAKRGMPHMARDSNPSYGNEKQMQGRSLWEFGYKTK